MPVLSDSLCPPVVRGAESLTSALVTGVTTQELLAQLTGPFADDATVCSALYDTAVLAMLMNQRDLGLSLQRDLLGRCMLFRFASRHPPRIRVLAIAAPGDLQMNMPIEFITAHLDVRLDLLVLVPGQPLPATLPDHDLAFCVISDTDPQALHRAAQLLSSWPRPVLNHPARVAGGQIAALTRDGYARMFAQTEGICAPETARVARDVLEAVVAGTLLLDVWPVLIRPLLSHAGENLARLETAASLADYLATVSDDAFFVSRFIEYRDPDRLYRKLRVALVQGQAFLCHMGVSEHWMIHYLNAGMERSAAKRAVEAAAMAEFAEGFGRRHAAAFTALHAVLGLDYVVIDCGEAPDGRLLLFEVEMAAIVHLLDPADLFPYKPPQMRKVFAAFGEMLKTTSEGRFKATRQAA